MSKLNIIKALEVLLEDIYENSYEKAGFLEPSVEAIADRMDEIEKWLVDNPDGREVAKTIFVADPVGVAAAQFQFRSAKDLILKMLKGEE